MSFVNTRTDESNLSNLNLKVKFCLLLISGFFNFNLLKSATMNLCPENLVERGFDGVFK